MRPNVLSAGALEPGSPSLDPVGQTVCVHQLFVLQARQTPDACALRWRGATLSYRELAQRSNRMAQYLRKIGVTTEAVVALNLEASFELIVCLLGILKAGAVYLPLETSYPIERLHQLVADAEARVIITANHRSGEFHGTKARVIALEAETPWIAREPNIAPDTGVQGDHLAYLMYTSGSTGQPKGVMMSHAALLHKLTQPGAWGVADASIRAPLVGSIAFDASLLQMLMPITHGGSVLLLDTEERLNPQRLWAALGTAQVNLLDCTPSWLMSMLDSALDADADSSMTRVPLQRIVVGGEAFPPSLARLLWQRWPQCRIVNVYGPTEACIDAAMHEVTAADVEANLVPIGRALPGYRLYVLDQAQQFVPSGIVGELYIAGWIMARGYWRQPLQSADKFLVDCLDDSARMYRTGDMVLQGADGQIEFRGRIDRQVKIRGQRVELDEIESLLQKYDEVAAVAVLMRHDAKKNRDGDGLGEPRLVAYVVPKNSGVDEHALLEGLRAYAQHCMPSYMLPNRWMRLDCMPLGATGKLDRHALPAPSPLHAEDDGPTARDAMEYDLCRIWAEVLDMPLVGIDENFFELGGHSLLASTLMLRINRHFKTHLPLVSLFYHPTVAHLAVALSRSTHEGNASRLICLNQNKGGPNLFCIPPLSGVGTVYAGLSRALGKNCTVYALQATGLAQDPPGSASMAELAATFIQVIRSVQNDGPYHLCGYSAGGVIAYEMCRQLGAAGQKVGSLILIDPYCNEPYEGDFGYGAQRHVADDETFWRMCRELLDDMGLIDQAADPAIALAQKLWTQMLAPTEEKSGEDLSALAAQALGQTMDLDVFRLMIEGARNTFSAYCNYQPEPLPVLPQIMWMVQPDADKAAFSQARLQRWQQLLGPALRPRLIPGEHAHMLVKAHTIEALATVIEPLFSKAAS